MKINQDIRYAVSALISLVEEYPRCMSIKEIAIRRNISDKFLELIFKRFVEAGFVDSKKGRNGGYSLRVSADEISLKDIFDLVDSGNKVMRCQGQRNCDHGTMCSSHQVWQKLSESIDNFLSHMKLSDIVHESQTKHHNTIIQAECV